jgi:predicted  nucleic acid-binding Zn-ribbon protein
MIMGGQLMTAEQRDMHRRRQTGAALFSVYQNHKIKKELTEVNNVVREQTQLTNHIAELTGMQVAEAQKQTVLMERQAAQAEVDRLEKQKLNAVKQAVFEINQELKNIEKDPDEFNKVVRVFQIEKDMTASNITTYMVTEVSDKEYIQSVFDKIEDLKESLDPELVSIFNSMNFSNAIAYEAKYSKEACLDGIDQCRKMLSKMVPENLPIIENFIKEHDPSVVNKTAGLKSGKARNVAIGWSIPLFLMLIGGFVNVVAFLMFIVVPHILYVSLTAASKHTKRVKVYEEYLTAIKNMYTSELEQINKVETSVKDINNKIFHINTKLVKLAEKYDSIKTIFPDCKMPTIKVDDYLMITS